MLPVLSLPPTPSFFVEYIGISIFLHLFLWRLRICDGYTSRVTFRPAVSERASYLSYEDEEEFIDRLVNSRKEYERAILSAKEADMHSFDPGK